MPTINKWRLAVRDENDVIPESPFENEKMTAEWNHVFSYEHILPAMESAVYDYVLALEEERKITKSIISGIHPAMIPNASGGLTKHPILLMQADARARVNLLRENLALTPKALARLNNAAADEGGPQTGIEKALLEISKNRAVKK